jgi:hypothetical protein
MRHDLRPDAARQAVASQSVKLSGKQGLSCEPNHAQDLRGRFVR